jgi:hypothetical protein
VSAELIALWDSEAGQDSRIQTAKLIRKLVRSSSHEEALSLIARLEVLDLSVDPWMKRNWPLDLSVLQLLPRVNGVKLNGSAVKSLEPLTHLTSLKSLFLDEVSLENPEWIGSFGALEVLSARKCQLRNVDFISSLSALREVNLAENSLTTLKPFAQLETLRLLDVSFNLIDDLGPISKRRSLRVLRLRRNALTSLSGLEDLRDLDELDVRDNRVMTLKPIKDLSMLNTLGVAGNPLTDDDVDTIRRSIRLL